MATQLIDSLLLDFLFQMGVSSTSISTDGAVLPARRNASVGLHQHVRAPRLGLCNEENLIFCEIYWMKYYLSLWVPENHERQLDEQGMEVIIDT